MTRAKSMYRELCTNWTCRGGLAWGAGADLDHPISIEGGIQKAKEVNE